MNPQEKAKELVEEMYKFSKSITKRNAKECAIICCDELIEELRDFGDDNHVQVRINYYTQVKQEIEKM